MKRFAIAAALTYPPPLTGLRLLRGQGRRQAFQRSLPGHRRTRRRETVVSMLNDYQGDLKEFAVVVLVPTVLQKARSCRGKRIFDRLDAYSAPAWPNTTIPTLRPAALRNAQRDLVASRPRRRGRPLQALAGVTVEASFSVANTTS